MDAETENTASAEISKEEIEVFKTNIEAKLLQKLETRKQNFDASLNRPDETFLRKLDSNLKKNTAFVKKVKLFTESQKASLIKDFQVSS